MTDIEQKLSKFNSRSSNAKVVEYLSQGNIFDEIGKSRDEMTHSKMLRNILSLNNRTSSPFLPLKHLLDVLVTRDSQQYEVMDDALRRSILTNTIQIMDIEECEVEYTHDVDIYIKCTVHGCKRNVLELFIENKVNHREKDEQTKRYYSVCKPCEGKGNNKSSYKLFVYLTPLSSPLLSNYQQLSQSDKPQSDQYIQINYQDVLDYVITPILEDSYLPVRQRFVLNEYVNCLELPSLSDADKKNSREYTIMATSQKEKELIKQFMACEENQTLINASMAVAEKGNLYQVGDNKYLTKDDAIRLVLRKFVAEHSKWESIRYFSSFIGKQGGDYPFLIFAAAQSGDSLLSIPYDWYVWDGELYSSVSDALIALLPRYAGKHDLNDFCDVYSGRGGGMLISDKPKLNFRECVYGEGVCYVNNSCENYLVRINEVLQEHNFPIIKCIYEIEYEQLVSTNNWVAKYSRLPKEMYVRLDNTNFYFRQSVDISRFLQDSNLDCQENNQDDEYDLLRKFYERNRNLVISVMKIMLDDMDNPDDRREQTLLLEKMLRH